MYTISFGDPMNGLLRLGRQAVLTQIARSSLTSFAVIRSLKVHGYDKVYMLQTTRKIR
jgi:hypothetical protein